MKKNNSHSDRPHYYSPREAAWILGVEQSKVNKAIRTGALPTVRRRSRLVVPAWALHRVLSRPDQSSRDSWRRGGAP